MLSTPNSEKMYFNVAESVVTGNICKLLQMIDCVKPSTGGQEGHKRWFFDFHDIFTEYQYSIPFPSGTVTPSNEKQAFVQKKIDKIHRCIYKLWAHYKKRVLVYCKWV